jgi:multiple sugar transport system ATP-binding protein
MPPMNFIEGRICFKGDNVYFATKDHEINLPQSLKKVLATYKNKQVIMGIRPEHLLVEPARNSAENALTCKVQVVEPLGNFTTAYLEWNSQVKLAVIVESEMPLLVGQIIKVYIDIEKVHLFEIGDTGRNISLSKWT